MEGLGFLSGLGKPAQLEVDRILAAELSADNIRHLASQGRMASCHVHIWRIG